jgi:hypothetical protein
MGRLPLLALVAILGAGAVDLAQEPTGTLPEPVDVACPANHGLRDSVYVRCVRIADRTFAYDAPCT